MFAVVGHKTTQRSSFYERRHSCPAIFASSADTLLCVLPRGAHIRSVRNSVSQSEAVLQGTRMRRDNGASPYTVAKTDSSHATPWRTTAQAQINSLRASAVRATAGRFLFCRRAYQAATTAEPRVAPWEACNMAQRRSGAPHRVSCP